MSCVLLSYYLAIITIFVCNQIECCTEITSDINTLMATNPNFQSDPCYIKWKADQNAKLVDDLSLRQEDLQVSTSEYNRNNMEHVTIGRVNRQKRFTNSYSKRSTADLSAWEIFGIIAFAVGSVYCCVACKRICCTTDSTTGAIRLNETINLPWVTTSAPTQVQSTSVVFSDAFDDNDNIHYRSWPYRANANIDNESFGRLPAGSPYRTSENNGNENFSRLPENNRNTNYSDLPTSSPSRDNVPPLTSRQTSLPSYEEAVKMPTVPLKE